MASFSMDENAILAAVQEGMAIGVTLAGNNTAEAARDNLSGKVLHVRSNTLLNSVTSVVDTSDKDRPFARVGTKVKYGAAHEFGATIRAKKARNLAIPIGDALTPSGVPRRESPTDWPDLKLIPREGKAPLLARENADGSISPMYVLLPSVRIPKRPWLRPAFRSTVQENNETIQRAVGAQLARLN